MIVCLLGRLGAPQGFSHRDMKYTPDRWVILAVDAAGKTTNKVFAGWHGGYLEGDSWKLNSGNVDEREFPDRWEFRGASGSVYVCFKSSYGMNSYMCQVLSQWEEKLKPGQTIKILEGYAA